MKKILFIGIISILLGGCSLFERDFKNNNSKVSSKVSSNTIITKPGSVENQGITGEEYFDYYSSVYKCEFFPATGTQKMLVVPVAFEDTNLNSLLYSPSKVISDLNDTFNGTSVETGWESVASYYEKSSYGKLSIDADIYSEWVRLDKTCKEVMELNSMTYLDPTWYVVDYVVEYLRTNGVDLKEYDNDSDGFIDGIWLVYGERNYSHMRIPLEEYMNFLWAYTFWEVNNYPLVNSPKANVYCWGSYDFMYEGVNNVSPIKLDAHTFIHETGHMLGLDDYYDYDENSMLSPAGCLDMMDYNIGDHNAYSKYLLGWIEPQVFDFNSDSSYSLSSFEETGDCLLIPTSSGNNISPLEEYLFVEFYTPTGLNELDATYQYSSVYPLMFTQRGVKIYHVDARLGQFKKNLFDYEYGDYIRNYSYEDLVSSTSNDLYYDIFASNTSSRSYSKNYKLLNLISENDPNKAYYYFNTSAKNKDLFEKGSILKDYVFNDGNIFNYELEILNIGSEAVLYIK